MSSVTWKNPLPDRLASGMQGVAAAAVAFAAVAAIGADRPNVVFIMADDHGRHATSCYGGNLIQTPNIDRLAAGGMRFDRAMAGNSICSPSRAMLLTGKYNHLCGVRTLGGHFDGSQQTFPKLLQQAGYQTAIVGKWHLFTEPTGFDYFNVAPGNGGRYTDPLLKDSGQPWGSGDRGGALHKGYITDVITGVSLDWLKRRNSRKPFCLMLHHKASHSPHIPAPRHATLFADRVFPEPPNGEAGRSGNTSTWPKTRGKCNLYADPSKRGEAAAIKARFRELADRYQDAEVPQPLDNRQERQP